MAKLKYTGIKGASALNTKKKKKKMSFPRIKV